MNVPSHELPSRADAVSFWLRSRIWIGLRALRNALDGNFRRWSESDDLAEAPVRVRLRTPLWTEGPGEEASLVVGKVQNLRVAARAFNGVVVPAGAMLSFWCQLGRPSRRRGFVVGREVRSGCVIPTLAGGICQLSNALATCAQRAGFEVVERHAHSARVGQSLAVGDLDATVFWNYVDLRVRASVRWRIDVHLDAHELRVDIRSAEMLPTKPAMKLELTDASVMSTPTMRSCLSCNETDCFRHRSINQVMSNRQVWLLDGYTPEFRQWMFDRADAAELFMPVLPRWLLRWLLRWGVSGGGWTPWPTDADRYARVFGWPSLRRAMAMRLHARQAGRRQASIVNGQGWLAKAYACALRPEHIELVIDQGLLPELWLQGALGGRSYDVLAVALPMQEIEHRLDLASSLRKDCAAARTLVDFRVEPKLAQAEMMALRGARRIVTAHADVVDYWRQRELSVLELPWQMPASCRRPVYTCGNKPRLVFPASVLARKGACELSAALHDLSVHLRVLGTPSEDVALWRGLDVSYGSFAEDWTNSADLVVLPAHVEHAPRALLRAIAAGVPVIATPACGVRGKGVTLVAAGDVAGLRAAIVAALTSAPDVNASYVTVAKLV